MSPSEGAKVGGELPGADLHPCGHPQGLADFTLFCGGKPVRGEEAPGPGGLRQGGVSFISSSLSWLPSAFAGPGPNCIC